MDTAKRQSIALLAGAMAVLIVSLTGFVMATSGRSYTPRQVATNLFIAVGSAFAFYAVLLLIDVLQNLEGREERRRTAEVERFLDMLSEMRRLISVNWRPFTLRAQTHPDTNRCLVGEGPGDRGMHD